MTHPAVDLTSPNGIPLTQSNALSSSAGAIFAPIPYPHIMDTTNAAATVADLNFNAYPQTPVEEPSTENLIPAAQYANFVVDGSGLQNGGLMNNGTFPTRQLFFGDAVANALELIAQSPGKLADYNLDADRGDGWKGWHPQTGTTPATPPVNAVQD